MVTQISTLLNDCPPSQKEPLQQIKKKLEFMYDLLQETPTSRINTCTYEEGLRVLDAAERQIKHWLGQLANTKTNRLQKPNLDK
jgi:hypothetical protein